MGPGATRATASAAVEAVLMSICQATAHDADKLHLTHFGTFERKHRAARKGYDINTREMRDIQARSELTFKAAKGLLDH